MSTAAHGTNRNQPWQRDEFLGRYLGFPVIRLRDNAAARAAIEAASADAEWMIEARVPADRPGEVAALAQCGFRIVDTNVQLVRAARAAVPAPRCRLAQPSDEAAVRSVAARGFSQTRFHLDTRIPDAAANRVKEEWAGNYFRGQRGEWMVVAEDAQGVCGFNLVLRTPRDSLVVDLIAVDERARRQGLGAEMLEFAAGQCLARPAEVAIGTQIANATSLGLYTKIGFRPTNATYVFHLHRADLPR
jgi:dTDP-4-amino-4,6-dideoxy-D-galactose acyltransferase